MDAVGSGQRHHAARFVSAAVHQQVPAVRKHLHDRRIAGMGIVRLANTRDGYPILNVIVTAVYFEVLSMDRMALRNPLTFSSEDFS